ncbi:MAG TPA: 6-carboxytetrahydropterin synthase [Thermoanaerobaculia bacterium]
MPSYLLRVRDRFEAAHHLTSYRGAPEPSHGHSWQVEVALATDALDAEGMGFDFVVVHGALRDLVSRFDHRDINTVPPFDRVSPTSERLAAWFHQQLAEALADHLGEVGLTEVTVWEGADSSATYRP